MITKYGKPIARLVPETAKSLSDLIAAMGQVLKEAGVTRSDALAALGRKSMVDRRRVVLDANVVVSAGFGGTPSREAGEEREARVTLGAIAGVDRPGEIHDTDPPMARPRSGPKSRRTAPEQRGVWGATEPGKQIRPPR